MMRISIANIARLVCRLTMAFMVTGGCGDDNDQPSPDAATVSPATMLLEADCDGFFASPWPLSTRVTEDGTLDLAGFPVPEADILIRPQWSLYTGQRGFGTTSAIYVGFDRSLDEASLPADGAASMEPEASVYLVNIDPDSPDHGQRTPIACVTRPHPQGDCPGEIVACLPVPGFPLRPASLYGLYVTDELRAQDGALVVASRRWEQLEAQADAPDNSLAEAYAPLFDVAESNGGGSGRVVAGTVFPTQDPVGPMQALADWVKVQDPPVPTELAAAEHPFGIEEEDASYYFVRGTYDSPRFQDGEPPFAGRGGEITFDDRGAPNLVDTAPLAFTMSVPKAPMPEQGFPVAMVLHDKVIDATFRGHAGRADLAQDLASIGVVMFSIEAPLYASRNPSDVPDGTLFFNFSNTVAARDNIRQGAVDALVAQRLLQALAIEPDRSPTGTTLTFDRTRMFYVGHSVGSLFGPLSLAAGEGFLGAYFSAAQGTALLSIFDKTDPEPLLPTTRALLGLGDDEVLDPYHPSFALVQAAREPATAAVFAPHIYDWGEGHALHIWVSQALDDHTAPLNDNDVLVAALGLDPAGEIQRPIEPLALRDPSPQALPASLNRLASDGERYTALVSQIPNRGYEAFFESGTVRSQLIHWLESMINSGAAELSVPPESGN